MDGVNIKAEPRGRGSKYHHGSLADALLSAAMELLDAEGPDAVTVRAVARRANVAHSAPANHFKDRSALLTSLAVQIFSQLFGEIDTVVQASGPDNVTRLRAMGLAVIAFGLRYPNRYRLLWRRDTLDAQDSRLEASLSTLYERLKALLMISGDGGDLSSDSQVIAAWSLVHGYICLRLDANLVPGRDERTGAPREQAILDVFLAGLGAPK